jgi:iron(III) transport system ATP-binding protein
VSSTDAGAEAVALRPTVSAWSGRGRASAVIPAQLTFRAVSRRFGDRLVLDDVTFEVKEAEVVCLLGPSGCGKSTLLRIAAGIEEPSAGAVLIDNRVVASPSGSVPPEKRGIGLMFQDYALFPHLTVVENVMFGLRGLAKGEQRNIAIGALTRLGLGHVAENHPHQLSGGEQQRAALARALVPRPRVLLMDEPFSNLDRRMRDQVREETVTLLRETGVTAIMVTHDPEEAMRVSDRIVLMRAGRIAHVGTADAVYGSPPDIEAARFFCDVTEIQGLRRDGVIQTALGPLAAPDTPDGPVVVCVRPQSIRMRPPGEGTPARLVAVRFIGEAYLAEFAVMGIEGTVRARLSGHPGIRPGAFATIGIEEREVLVFEGGAP